MPIALFPDSAQLSSLAYKNFLQISWSVVSEPDPTYKGLVLRLASLETRLGCQYRKWNSLRARLAYLVVRWLKWSSIML